MIEKIGDISDAGVQNRVIVFLFYTFDNSVIAHLKK